MKEKTSYEERNLIKLLKWVDEYGIENEIREVLAANGFEAASRFTTQWFDGHGEADRICASYVL